MPTNTTSPIIIKENAAPNWLTISLLIAVAVLLFVVIKGCRGSVKIVYPNTDSLKKASRATDSLWEKRLDSLQADYNNKIKAKDAAAHATQDSARKAVDKANVRLGSAVAELQRLKTDDVSDSLSNAINELEDAYEIAMIELRKYKNSTDTVNVVSADRLRAAEVIADSALKQIGIVKQQRDTSIAQTVMLAGQVKKIKKQGAFNKAWAEVATAAALILTVITILK